jgi:hypothetical protein
MGMTVAAAGSRGNDEGRMTNDEGMTKPECNVLALLVLMLGIGCLKSEFVTVWK